jgi:outer membrane protein assembly factor BamB
MNAQSQHANLPVPDSVLVTCFPSKLAILFRTALALLAVAWVSLETNAGELLDWPVARGDAFGNALSACKLSEKPEVLWEFKTSDAKEGFEGTPVIADGRVYVGDFEGNIRAIDLKDGRELWKVKTKDGFVTAAAFHEGRVVIGDFSGQVYCMDAATGKQLWTREMDQQVASGASFYRGDVLLTLENGSMHTLNLSDGEPKWSYATGDQLRSSATIWKDYCLLGGCDGRLHKIDLIKGEAIGDSIPLDAPTLSTPSVMGNIAIVPTQPGVVFAINVETNKVVWRFANEEMADDIRSSPAMTGKIEGEGLAGLAVVNTRKRRVLGLNLADGSVAWEAIIKKRSDSSPVLCDGRAWVGAADGMVYGINLADGKETWSYQLSGQILASPAIADNKLIIATEKGSIVCFGSK